jgi:hypothetical protein
MQLARVLMAPARSPKLDIVLSLDRALFGSGLIFFGGLARRASRQAAESLLFFITAATIQ